MDTSLDLTLSGFMMSFLLLVLELFRVRWCFVCYFQAVLHGVPFTGVQVLRSKRLILLNEKGSRALQI